MGNHANYVLIENGEHRIYYSRWGALTIPRVLLTGPEATLAYVRDLTPDDYLLTEIWAEGAILLDLDAHRLRFFGGDDLVVAPHLRRLFLPMIAELWPGWDTQWTRRNNFDLALALGWDPARVADSHDYDSRLLEGDDPLIQPSQLQTLPSLENANLLLTVRWDDGSVADYATETSRLDTLSLGPTLLELLRSRDGVQVPREDQAPQCAFLDGRTREMWLADFPDPRYDDALARRWPGWDVRVHTEGLVRQLVLSGRDPASYKVPREQAADELIEELTRNVSIDLLGLSAAMTRESESVTFGKAFFSADGPPATAEDPRELLLRLCERVQGY